MNELTFVVKIKFADEIVGKKNMLIVAENIAQAIDDATNGRGIAPEDCETYTTDVEVTAIGLDEPVKIKIA